MLGFLSASAQSDPVFYNSTLDLLLTDDILGEWFPYFQTCSIIDERGLERFHRAVELGKAKIHTFQNLAYGRVHESLKDDDLAILLEKILSKENGVRVVIEIFQVRYGLRSAEDKAPKISAPLLSVGRDLLLAQNFNERPERHEEDDRKLAGLASMCLTGEDGVSTAAQVTQRLAKAIKNRRIYTFDYPRLLAALARVQPTVFLDVFMEISATEPDAMVFSRNPLNEISDDDLVSWCEKDPGTRFPIIASAIDPFRQSGESGKLEWKPIVYVCLENAPDLDAILDNLAKTIWPQSWGGSLADVMLTREVLFEQLFEHENSRVRAWAKKQHLELQDSIRKERESERRQHHERNARFESFES
jgi:hypothetical protein